jgi:hypothetical protein
MKRVKLVFAMVVACAVKVTPLGGLLGCALAFFLFCLDVLRLEFYIFLEKYKIFLRKKPVTPMHRRIKYYLIGVALWTWPCLPLFFNKPIVPDNLVIPIIIWIVVGLYVYEQSLLRTQNLSGKYENQVVELKSESLPLRKQILCALISIILTLILHYPEIVWE